MKHKAGLLILLALMIGCQDHIGKTTPYDEEIAMSLVETESGDVVFAGLSVHVGRPTRGNPLDSAPPIPFPELYLAKVGQTGDRVWEKFVDVNITSANDAIGFRGFDGGGFEIAGVRYRETPHDGLLYSVFTVLIDEAGNVDSHADVDLEIDAIYHIDEVVPRREGGFAFIGYGRITESDERYFLVLTDADHQIELFKLLDFGNRTAVTGMIEGLNGDIAISWKHSGNSYSGESGFMIISRDGTIVKDESWEYAQFITEAISSTDDGYVLAGQMDSSIGVRQLSTAGEIVGSKRYYVVGVQEASEIVQTDNGDFVVVGRDLGYYDQWVDTIVMRVSPAGEMLWSTTVENESNKHFHDLKATNDGGFIVGGGAYLSPGGDAYLLKISATGEVLWEALIGI